MAGTRALDTSFQSTVDAAVATLVLRRRGRISLPASGAAALTSQQLETCAGACPQDIARVRLAAARAGLSIVTEHAASRRLRVRGPADVVRAWVDETPNELGEVVVAVLGDTGPCAYPRLRIAYPHAEATSYTPLQLAQIYAMPQGDGSGQTIAIIELGGGFNTSDLVTYFQSLGLAVPAIQAVSVDGASNQPVGNPNSADAEVQLDVEVAGAIAPKANILVYFAPNTDAGFLDAISTAAHASPAPTAMSISWGASEDTWSASTRTAMDEAFADAVAMGVTITTAAGDNGSSDDDSSNAGPHVDFPSSSPHVLGCGGTSLTVSGDKPATETVWNDGGSGGATGGGVSDVFALPTWQVSAGVPANASGGSGRGVPDVAAVADPQTGYQVLVDGEQIVVGGTSAVAPLWAGLLARLAQHAGKPAGLAQTVLYKGVASGKAAAHLRDITQGNNGAWQAGSGWDPCTGLGVPDAATATAFPSGTPPSPTPPPAPAPTPTPPPAPPSGTVLADLHAARTAIDNAISALTKNGSSSTNNGS